MKLWQNVGLALSSPGPFRKSPHAGEVKGKIIARRVETIDGVIDLLRHGSGSERLFRISELAPAGSPPPTTMPGYPDPRQTSPSPARSGMGGSLASTKKRRRQSGHSTRISRGCVIRSLGVRRSESLRRIRCFSSPDERPSFDAKLPVSADLGPKLSNLDVRSVTLECDIVDIRVALIVYGAGAGRFVVGDGQDTRSP
jgi:hypothetical protein